MGGRARRRYSYYGPINLVAFNVGYHVEHHDFMNIPGWRLPELTRMVPDYAKLASHTSWTGVHLALRHRRVDGIREPHRAHDGRLPVRAFERSRCVMRASTHNERVLEVARAVAARASEDQGFASLKKSSVSHFVPNPRDPRHRDRKDRRLEPRPDPPHRRPEPRSASSSPASLFETS